MPLQDFDYQRQITKSEISSHFIFISNQFELPSNIKINVDGKEVHARVDSKNRIYSRYIFHKFHFHLDQEIQIIRKNDEYFFSVIKK